MENGEENKGAVSVAALFQIKSRKNDESLVKGRERPISGEL